MSEINSDEHKWMSDKHILNIYQIKYNKVCGCKVAKCWENFNGY